jgi:hypothetical protein
MNMWRKIGLDKMEDLKKLNKSTKLSGEEAC